MADASWSQIGQLTDRIVETPKKMFFLDVNKLDGTSQLFDSTVQVGYGGGVLSASDGTFNPPVEVEVVVPETTAEYIFVAGNNKLRIYPIIYGIEVLHRDTVVHTGQITKGALETFIDLGTQYTFDTIRLSITKINRGNTAVKLLEVNTYEIVETKEVFDTQRISGTDTMELTGMGRYDMASSDLVRLSSEDWINQKEVQVHDTTYLRTQTKFGKPNDVHQALRRPTRQVHCKVIVKFTRMGEDASTTINASSPLLPPVGIRNLINGIRVAPKKYAYVGSSNLTDYHPLPANPVDAPVTFDNKSNSSGELTTPLTITTTFSARYLNRVILAGNAPDGNYPVDFTVTVYDNKNAVIVNLNIKDNKDPNWEAAVEASNAVKIVHTITKISLPKRHVQIQELFGSLVLTYMDDQIIRADILEEMGAETTGVGLGRMSANQLSLSLLNENGMFNYNNATSPLRNLLKTNREIQVFYGTTIDTSEIVWEPMGTFWSGPWKTSFSSMEVNTVANDRLSQLTTLHQLPAFQNINLLQLLRLVLLDAGVTEDEMELDADLANIFLSVAFFGRTSHSGVLDAICKLGYINIFATRLNKIKAVYTTPTRAIAPTDIILTMGTSDFTDYSDIDQDEVNIAILDGPTYASTTGVLGTLKDIQVPIQAGQIIQYTVDLGLDSIISASKATTPIAGVAINIISFSSYAVEVQITNNTGATVTLNEITVEGTYLKAAAESVVYKTTDEKSIRENGALPWSETNPLASAGIGPRLVEDTLKWYSGEHPYQKLEARGDYALQLYDGIILPDYKDGSKDAIYRVRRVDHRWDGAYDNTLDVQYYGALT